jgi:environmental stress-induced protein Ves
MRLIRSADCALLPWVNGGGVTRDLACGMPAATDLPPGGPSFDWRLSLTDIDRDGPFSTLAGVDRVFAPVASLPDGARCRALNLQLARGRCEGAMRRVAVAGPGDLLILEADCARPRALGAALLLEIVVAPRAAAAALPHNVGRTR